ncbi:hypothetical protein OUZ56_002515 [Daphnia magna]|uniref:Transmembrane protein n=1 Tax=Daphnia magna TaxID=35525 RepID=A0ABR0A5Z0_9CRUS|nr:hypothetical protein OUZ56_002515 [Daphnia magna]
MEERNSFCFLLERSMCNLQKHQRQRGRGREELKKKLKIQYSALSRRRSTSFNGLGDKLDILSLLSLTFVIFFFFFFSPFLDRIRYPASVRSAKVNSDSEAFDDKNR